MHVVGHQAVCRAEDALAGGRMQHKLPEQSVEGTRKPAGCTVQDRESPVDD
jgi:hypothetical protein